MNDERSKSLGAITAFLFTFVLVAIAFLGFFRFGFGADTMTHYLNPLINIESKLPYARYISYFIEITLYKMGIILPEHYRLFYILFLLVTAAAAFIYQQIFVGLLDEKGMKTDIIQEYFGRAILSLPFISTLYSEYFMFPECFAFCVGFLFSAIAVLLYSRKKYIGVALFLIMAVFTYQVTVMISAVYMLLYVVVKYDFILTAKMFWRGLISSLSCIFAGFINYIVSRIFFYLGVITDTPKQISMGSVFDRIRHALYILKTFFISGNGLVPIPYANAVVALSAVILIIVCNKDKIREAFTILFAGMIMFCLAIVIPLIQSDAPRVIFVLYAALGCMVALSYVQLKGREKSIMQVVIVGAVFLQIFANQQIAVNHYISNAQDIACARAVLSAIDDYEKETGKTVTKIATCSDSVCYNHYENVYYTLEQINERVAVTVPYSLLEYVNKMDKGTTERRFKKSKKSPAKVRSEYFDGMEWDRFNVNEQLIIKGKTAYWCMY